MSQCSMYFSKLDFGTLPREVLCMVRTIITKIGHPVLLMSFCCTMITDDMIYSLNALLKLRLETKYVRRKLENLCIIAGHGLVALYIVQHGRASCLHGLRNGKSMQLSKLKLISCIWFRSRVRLQSCQTSVRDRQRLHNCKTGCNITSESAHHLLTSAASHLLCQCAAHADQWQCTRLLQASACGCCRQVSSGWPSRITAGCAHAQGVSQQTLSLAGRASLSIHTCTRSSTHELCPAFDHTCNCSKPRSGCDQR